MIIKLRKEPVAIAGYEALLKRLPRNHGKRGLVQDNLTRLQAGFGGEERVDRMLKHFDPPYPYVFIRDLALPDAMECQIDNVLITPGCIVLMEVKNISGRIRIRSNPSAMQRVSPDGETKGFRSPIAQMEAAQMKVEKLVQARGYEVPVRSVLVIAYPTQIIEEAPGNAIILAADEVEHFLTRMHIGEPKLTKAGMKELGQHLLANHQEFNPFPLAPRFQIPLSDIERGVFCPRCRLQKMTRHKRTWECRTCMISSTNAHFQALDEWFMIMKSTITTSECRDFLALTNLDAAKRVLKRETLKEAGSRRYRRYYRSSAEMK